MTPPNFINLTGRKFGRLTVLGRDGSDPQGQAMWACRCDCGGCVRIRGAQLRGERAKSCGCLAQENARKLFTTHGDTGSTEHDAWRSMIDRCTLENSVSYERYGGAGVSITSRWRGRDGFANFLSDMGRKPSPDHTLDRIRNDRGYEPSNCRWATALTQQNNRTNNVRVEINGVTRTMSEWCRDTGVAVSTAHARMRRGWAPHRAVTEPPIRTGRWG